MPTYKPSALPTSIIAALARVTMSIGGTSKDGTPPTPMPTLGWIGMVASFVQALTNVTERAMFHGDVLPEFVLMTGPKILAPAFSTS